MSTLLFVLYFFVKNKAKTAFFFIKPLYYRKKLELYLACLIESTQRRPNNIIIQSILFAPLALYSRKLNRAYLYLVFSSNKRTINHRQFPAHWYKLCSKTSTQIINESISHGRLPYPPSYSHRYCIYFDTRIDTVCNNYTSSTFYLIPRIE